MVLNIVNFELNTLKKKPEKLRKLISFVEFALQSELESNIEYDKMHKLICLLYHRITGNTHVNL